MSPKVDDLVNKERRTTLGTVSHEEIAHLAYEAWQRDGCPQGRDVAYWLEAESQLKATKHLLAKEVSGNGELKRRAARNGRVISKVH